MIPTQCVIFDLDGTLLDSDAALVQPFLELGMAPEDITFGHPVEEFCADHGIDVMEYVDRYDTDAALPFVGVDELVARLGRWAICSNKHPVSGVAELARLGWVPERSAFSDTFEGRSKDLGPVLHQLGLVAADVAFVGDTAHDQACAQRVGCRFVWAGWNPRTRASAPIGDVAAEPMDVMRLLGLG